MKLVNVLVSSSGPEIAELGEGKAQKNSMN
jgi:hypothetical protein